jgi:hypothetical protein
VQEARQRELKGLRSCRQSDQFIGCPFAQQSQFAEDLTDLHLDRQKWVSSESGAADAIAGAAVRGHGGYRDGQAAALPPVPSSMRLRQVRSGKRRPERYGSATELASSRELRDRKSRSYLSR